MRPACISVLPPCKTSTWLRISSYICQPGAWAISKLACQPLPGAGMNTHPREGLDDLVVGVTPRFGEAMSSRTQHRKSKKNFSVTAYVDNNCSGSLPALD